MAKSAIKKKIEPKVSISLGPMEPARRQQWRRFWSNIVADSQAMTRKGGDSSDNVNNAGAPNSAKTE